MVTEMGMKGKDTRQLLLGRQVPSTRSFETCASHQARVAQQPTMLGPDPVAHHDTGYTQSHSNRSPFRPKAIPKQGARPRTVNHVREDVKRPCARLGRFFRTKHPARGTCIATRIKRSHIKIESIHEPRHSTNSTRSPQMYHQRNQTALESLKPRQKVTRYYI